VTHILLQLLEIITSNKAAEVLTAQQHIDLWVTLGLPNSCVHAIQFVFGKSVIGPKEALIRIVIQSKVYQVLLNFKSTIPLKFSFLWFSISLRHEVK